MLSMLTEMASALKTDAKSTLAALTLTRPLSIEDKMEASTEYLSSYRKKAVLSLSRLVLTKHISHPSLTLLTKAWLSPSLNGAIRMVLCSGLMA
jgi:hypothetical protein